MSAWLGKRRTHAKTQPDNHVAVDEQTGKPFRVEEEEWNNVPAAWLSILYLVAMLALLVRALFQVWIGHPPLLEGIAGEGEARLGSPLFRLMAYTAIGGALGAIANGIRSFMYWHLDNRGFGGRFFWKYFSLSPLGALLAVIVYATIRGGLASVAGNVAPSEGSAQSMSALALGALAGYGSHQVFVWLDDKVSKLLKVSDALGKKVPNLKDRRQAEAEAMLKTADLNLGKVDTAPSDDPGKAGKVADQTPAPGSPIATSGGVTDKVVEPDCGSNLSLPQLGYGISNACVRSEGLNNGYTCQRSEFARATFAFALRALCPDGLAAITTPHFATTYVRM